jgi:hypothetical protein
MGPEDCKKRSSRYGCCDVPLSSEVLFGYGIPLFISGQCSQQSSLPQAATSNRYRMNSVPPTNLPPAPLPFAAGECAGIYYLEY